MSAPSLTFRPIDVWPGELTRERRRSPFGSDYASTLDLLGREMAHLRARDAVLMLALQESDLRRDGMPRSGARPAHPGVIVAFDSKHGPLKYATDVFTDWQSNLRAVALGLESLRRVDRYGITKRGEQYTDDAAGAIANASGTLVLFSDIVLAAAQYYSPRGVCPSLRYFTEDGQPVDVGGGM
jgi:hypothetical protein